MWHQPAPPTPHAAAHSSRGSGFVLLRLRALERLLTRGGQESVGGCRSSPSLSQGDPGACSASLLEISLRGGAPAALGGEPARWGAPFPGHLESLHFLVSCLQPSRVISRGVIFPMHCVRRPRGVLSTEPRPDPQLNACLCECPLDSELEDVGEGSVSALLPAGLPVPRLMLPRYRGDARADGR